MDKKLLGALNNLSIALEEIANSISDSNQNKQKSATAATLQSGNLANQIKMIDKGIKEILSDNKKIIKNQETIMSLSKQRSNDTGVLGQTADPKQKNKIKDGVSTIIMIAVGVLAIGLAFKLLDRVNVASVIAISIALPLLALAFERIAKMNLKPSQMLSMVGVTVAISTAIALSSLILGYVKPVGLFKLTTSIMIAGMFSAMSYGLVGILTAFSKANIPISSAIKMSMTMPILLVAISAAIAGSSWLLNEVKPVGIFKLFTSVLISLAFIPISYSLPFLARAVKDLNITKVLLLPIMLVAMASAIMLTSHIFDKTKPISFGLLMNIVFQSLTLSAIALTLGFAIKYLGDKVSISSALKGGIVIIVIATALMASSHILAAGNYSKYPDIIWALNAGSSLLIFGMQVALFGFIATSGIGLVGFALGSVVLIGIAAVVLATSHILAAGDYSISPPMSWVIPTTLSLAGFGLLALTMGGFALTGLGGIAFLLGLPMILAVAKTIVSTSEILSGGNYNVPGMVKWAIATTMLYAAFTPILLVLGTVALANSVLSVFGINPFKKANEMILDIARTIVDTSFILQEGDYRAGPTKEWAEGVSISIGAFSPVYAMLVRNKVMEAFGMGGVGPDDFNRAIRTVVGGIIFAAGEFAGNTAVFKDAPPKKWAEGVGLAISAFAPVYTALAQSKGWLTKGPSVDEMKKAIMTISMGIVDSAKYFGENEAVFDLSKIPDKKWGEGVGGAIAAFMPALEFISKNTGIFRGNGSKMLIKGISGTSEAIKLASNILSGGNYKTLIPETWMKNVNSNIRTYVNLAKYLTDNGINSFNSTNVLFGMSALATGYDRLAKGVSKLGVELEKIDTEKLVALKNLSGSIVLLSLMDTDQFSSMMDALEEKASIFVDVINDLDTKTEKAQKGKKIAPSPKLKTSTQAGVPQKSMNDLYGILESVDSRLVEITRSNDNLSKYVDEIRGSDLQLKTKR